MLSDGCYAGSSRRGNHPRATDAALLALANSADSRLRSRTSHPYHPAPEVLEVVGSRMFRTRVIAVALATVLGCLGAAPTLAAEE